MASLDLKSPFFAPVPYRFFSSSCKSRADFSLLSSATCSQLRLVLLRSSLNTYYSTTDLSEPCECVRDLLPKSFAEVLYLLPKSFAEVPYLLLKSFAEPLRLRGR